MINLGTLRLNKVAVVPEVLANKVLVAFLIFLKIYLALLARVDNEKHVEMICVTT